MSQPPPPFGPPPPRQAAAPSYELTTRKPIAYLPVILNGQHVGYLWAGLTVPAASFIRRNEFLREAFETPFAWSTRLEQAHARGRTALEAIRSWIGAPEDPVAGGIPADAQEQYAADLAELRTLANPDLPQEPEPFIQDGEFADGTPVDRSKGWGPLHFELPPTYPGETEGPVRYHTVVKGEVVVGYLWASDDAASFITRKDSGLTGMNAGGAWIVRLRDLFAEGVPAPEALRRCAAMPEDDEAGVALHVVQEAPSPHQLEQLASEYRQSMRISFDPAPDDLEAWRRPPVPEQERDALLRYLQWAPAVYDGGFRADEFDPARPERVPDVYRTDGTWIWLGGVGHHFEVHGISPEPDLVEHIRAAGFRLPEVSEESLDAAAATLRWNGILKPPPPA